MTGQKTWSYDRPTAPGYYWTIVAGAPEVVHIAYPYPEKSGYLLVWVIDENGPERLTHCNGWLWWPEAIQAPEVIDTRPHYVGP